MRRATLLSRQSLSALSEPLGPQASNKSMRAMRSRDRDVADFSLTCSTQRVSMRSTHLRRCNARYRNASQLPAVSKLPGGDNEVVCEK
jgi:hypothetical protein